jgi:hypothetical protein
MLAGASPRFQHRENPAYRQHAWPELFCELVGRFDLGEAVLVEAERADPNIAPFGVALGLLGPMRERRADRIDAIAPSVAQQRN